MTSDDSRPGITTGVIWDTIPQSLLAAHMIPGDSGSHPGAMEP